MDVFSKRLKELRGDKNQSIIAKDLNIMRATMSTYENGREPSYEILISIAKYFNVSVDYLLGLSSDRRPVGDSISQKLSELAPIVATSDAVPLSSEDILMLVQALIDYYQGGAPAGNTVLDSLRGYIIGIPPLVEALLSGSASQTLDEVNSIAIQQLKIMDVMAQFLKNKEF